MGFFTRLAFSLPYGPTLACTAPKCSQVTTQQCEKINSYATQVAEL